MKETITADPNQKYWDLGLKCFKEGDVATIAMQTIWNAMSPPASLPLCATIVGALYGDTYWNVTKMDVTKLSSDLRAALGINPADCDRAAKAAFSQWHGMLVRGNMSDYGNQIPRDPTGPLTNSPDVVVNGAAPLTVEQLIRQWNVYIYTPQPGLKNNTYGRAASVNLNVPIAQPVLRMFYTDAGFNPPPSSWVKLFTFDGKDTSPIKGMESTTIPPAGRAASSDSFAFTPPGSGHYCLIAVAGTEFFTNDPLATGGNWSSYEWLNYNGASGWHNVDVATSNEAVLKFYNQDGTTERFVLEAHARNLPAGSMVSLECADPKLGHPIATPMEKISKASQVIRVEADLPPHFDGKLKVRFDLPGGQKLPKNASVEVRMQWVVPHGHTHYHDAVAHLGDVVSAAVARPVFLPMGSFVFVGS